MEFFEGRVRAKPGTPLTFGGGGMSAEIGTVGSREIRSSCEGRFAHVESGISELYRWQETQNGALNRLAESHHAMQIELVKQCEFLKLVSNKVDEVLLEMRNARNRTSTPPTTDDKDRVKWLLYGLALAAGGGSVKLLELLGK